MLHSIAFLTLLLYDLTYADERARGIHCVHCASPRSVIKKDTMLDAMDQLFDFRQTFYPYSVVSDDCTALKNITSHKLIHCHYPMCYAIVFNDHSSGSSALTVRGCAESFLPPQPSQNRTKQYCRRVHKTLDITECTCPGRAYCSKSLALSAAPLLLCLTAILAFIFC